MRTETISYPLSSISYSDISYSERISPNEFARGPRESKLIREIRGHSKFRIPNSKFQIPNSKFRIPNSRFQIPDSRFQIPNSRFQIPNSEFQIPDSRFQIPNSRFQIPNPNSRFQIPDSKSEIPNPESEIVTACMPTEPECPSPRRTTGSAILESSG
ncbi:MAG: hypothetical protein IPN69_21810 [Acidobacteria bacterium]|nr:hypothetical protein [Acidobacteriota bacterium]